MKPLKWRWIFPGASLGLHLVFPALLAFDPPAFVMMAARPAPWLFSAACWIVYGFLLGLGAEAFQRWTSRQRSGRMGP